MFDRFLAWLDEFTEAGRALNKQNTTKIQQIHDHAASLLHMECAGRGQMREAWRSFGENAAAVQSAICELMDCGCWIQDIWDDRAVFCCYDPDKEGTYQISYTISADGAVTLGTPVQVRAVTTYEPVPDSLIEPPEPAGATGAIEEAATIEGDCVPLIEAATQADGRIPIKIIQPGWGSSGYYAESVLKRDIPTAFPIGTKMYWNHPTATEAAERPERDLDYLAAKTTSAPVWRADGPAGPGMYAEAEVYNHYADKVRDLGADIGLSIIARGFARTGEADGRTGPIIEKITAGDSIDFVTTPGAGGAILTRFAEAARPAQRIQENPPMPESEDLKRLREAHDAMALELARMREAQITARGRELVRGLLAGDDELLPITRERLFEAQIKNLPIANGALDETALTERVQDAARVEKAYLAQTGATGRISGMGGSRRPEPTEADVQTALADVFRVAGLSESGAAIAARGRR